MSDIPNKWIIKYNKNQFDYREILEFLPQLSNTVKFISNDIIKFYINFDKSFNTNHYYLQDDKKIVIIELNDFVNNISESENKIPIITKLKNKIKADKINLLYPALTSDKRWNSIELPTSSIFLGSGLANNKMEVKINKLFLPSSPTTYKDFQKYNVTGISIFEDLFIEISEFLKLFSNFYSGLIVGGGPMVTLSPLKTAYHLDAVNLLIRGEAEMVFPNILLALSSGDLKKILLYRGFILNLPGILILSDIDHINKPDNFDKFNFNLNFVENNQLKRGLEINISRGCERSCIFCSKVQGKVLRKIEPDKFEYLLSSINKRINNIDYFTDEMRTLNINDDDILQDTTYASKIFKIIIKNDFKIWGIQTSIQSFFKDSKIDNNLISIINNKKLFVGKQPLIWLGTDAFLKARGKKLAKFIPDIEQLTELIKIFETEKIKNIHYWISSDPDSTWSEFISEFIMIESLKNKFKYFGILAHAPFLIPYLSTPLTSKLLKSDNYLSQLVYKKKIFSKKSLYNISFAERVETKFKYLNRLLSNEKTVGNKGFFDYFKENDSYNSFLTIYNLLKKERIEAEANNDFKMSSYLLKDENKIETILSEL